MEAAFSRHWAGLCAAQQGGCLAWPALLVRGQEKAKLKWTAIKGAKGEDGLLAVSETPEKHVTIEHLSFAAGSMEPVSEASRLGSELGDLFRAVRQWLEREGAAKVSCVIPRIRTHSGQKPFFLSLLLFET